MKVKALAVTLAVAVAMGLTLAGCSNGTLRVDAAEEGDGVQIVAESATKDYSVTSSLEVGEGDCICISPILDKGSLHVTIGLEGEDPVVDADFDGKVLSYHAAAPGDYDLQVSGVDGASGTMSILTPSIEDVVAMDASLAEALDVVASDLGTAALANPWAEDIASASEAAMAAGIADFAVPEGAVSDFDEPLSVAYRATDGLAEADYDYGASAVTIRKGTPEVAGEDGDVSGDYTSYAHEWTQTVGSYEVACYGNREGDAAKAVWKGGQDMYFSIVVEGLGGDDDFGLNEERLEAFVAQIA